MTTEASPHCSCDIIDKQRLNVRCSFCHEFGFEYDPQRLAARERQHQSAQDRRPRWPREIATASRSRRIANGIDRATRWPAPAQLRIAFGISSKAGRAHRAKGRGLPAYA